MTKKKWQVQVKQWQRYSWESDLIFVTLACVSDVLLCAHVPEVYLLLEYLRMLLFSGDAAKMFWMFFFIV